MSRRLSFPVSPVLVMCASSVLLAACGGGEEAFRPVPVATVDASVPPVAGDAASAPGQSSQPSDGAEPPSGGASSPMLPPLPQYTIGGTVKGLSDSNEVVLQNGDGETVTVKANGGFKFPTSIASGAAYAVTVKTQPSWQFCTVQRGSGNAAAEVSDVALDCVDAQAQVKTLAGTGQRGATNGPAAAATFDWPYGVAVGNDGTVYVADTLNRQIRRISPLGEVSTFAGTGRSGATDGDAKAAEFDVPTALTIDAVGNVFVADRENHRIRKVAPSGVVSTVAGSVRGNASGHGTAAQFYYPAGIAHDDSGNLYVADQGNRAIRKITSAGDVSSIATSIYGAGLVVDLSGNLFVAGGEDHTIFKITPQGAVTKFAGSGTAGNADGIGAAASFNDPAGLAIDRFGNLYVADSGNSRIRRITPAGVVTTLAGSSEGFENGVGTAATFAGPFGIWIDAKGTIYVADTYNNAIRTLTPVPPTP